MIEVAIDAGRLRLESSHKKLSNKSTLIVHYG